MPKAAGVVEYLPFRKTRRLLARSVKYAFQPLPRPVIVRALRLPSPLVSVIIATYNWSAVLRYAIRSILWQTEQDFEILVVGDGCTDDSESVVHSFEDARIRWTNLETNSGHQSAPNNAGLEMARGEYCAYLGHDDIWHPAHLRTLVDAARRGNADFSSSLVEWIGPEGSQIRIVRNYLPPGGYDGAQALTPSGVMHRRDVVEKIGGWRDYRTIWRTPDADLEVRAFEAGMKFVSTSELTVFKFNSTLRRNCYRDRPCDLQPALTSRIERDRWFMPREAMRIAYVHGRRLPMTLPSIPPPPEPHTLGWTVSQFRKMRGLDGPDL
jgi:glycosyltransferase involved in cell wall biosynthesis